MVALCERGELLAGAIYLPEREQLLCAERGLGAFVDGERLLSAERLASEIPRLRGTADARYLPEADRAELERRTAGHELVPGVTCAAHEYTEIALGRKDYVVYFRLMPWDHAPGALIVREAGGVVRHPSGRDYQLSDRAELTLLAPNEARWQRAERELFAF
jgi:fructose-1,6-bisphosphatase/inositol monophosphatase family enzyme